MNRREDTLRRVTAALKEQEWPTATELSRVVGLTPGTVRSYLHELIVRGDVERRSDASVRSPRGGANRFNLLQEPLGAPRPTDQRLCDACIQDAYGDRSRYFAAFTGGPDPEDPWDVDDKDFIEPTEEQEDAYYDNARCDRCGGRRFLPVENN